MLEIINERGEILELSDDVAIAFEKNNTLFNDSDILLSDLSYQSSAPLTARNKLFISFAHRIDSEFNLYSLEVSVYINSELLCGGTLSLSIKDNKINFTIKPNYSAVAQKANSILCNQIRLGSLISLLPGQTLPDLMKLSCQNPASYNYVFAPIYNPQANWEGKGYDYINFWDFDAQVFKITRPDLPVTERDDNIVYCRFIKINFFLQNLLTVLGYKAEGDVFTDPEFSKKYMYYHEKGSISGVTDKTFLLYLLPDETIGSFIKKLKTRYHLCFDFNHLNKTVTVSTFKQIKNNSIVHNLDNYIEKVVSIELKDNKGISVSLKPDKDDLYFVEPVADGSQKAVASNKLVVGAGGKDIEIDMSTLKPYQDGLKKSVSTNKGAFLDPAVINQRDTWKPETVMRTFIYNGMVTIEGKQWPETVPDELNDDDVSFFVFLAQTKQVKAVANIPASLLVKIKINHQISFTTDDGVLQNYIIEKISYDLTDNSSLIKVELILHALAYKTMPYAFERVNPEAEDLATFLVFKFNKEIIPQINFAVNYRVFNGIDSYDEGVSVSGIITQPCDNYGLGGQRIFVPRRPNIGSNIPGYTLVIFNPAAEPQHLSFYGTEIPFTFVQDPADPTQNYYFVALPVSPLGSMVVF